MPARKKPVARKKKTAKKAPASNDLAPSKLIDQRIKGLGDWRGTFAKGAKLKDPTGLFNSSLTGGMRRAIDFYMSDEVDDETFKALIREAVRLNESGKS